MNAETLLAALLLAPVLAAASDVGAPLQFQTAPAFFATAVPGSDVLFETSPSDDQAEDSDTVLFHGEYSGKDLRFEVSRKLTDGTWSPWSPAFVQRYDNGRYWGRAALPPGRGGVRLRALSAGRRRKDFKLYAIEVFEDQDREPRPGTPRPQAPPPARPKPSVHGRDEWHAAKPKEPYEPILPERITIHHSDGKYTTTLEESLQEAKIIQDFHIHGRKWNDIAYHYLIDAAGNIVEGRPENVLGAHAGDREKNMNNVGVVFLGTFHPPKNDPVTEKAVGEAFVNLGRYLVARYKIKPATLKGHRDLKETDCPGDELYALLPKLREQLAIKAPAPRTGAAAFRPLILLAPRFP